MRSSLVLTIVSLLFLGVVLADTDVCETTTADVKAASRVLNMWRAACEDHNWKGSTCYNYWAQLNEVLTLENSLQTCLARIHQQHSEYMLGTPTQLGAYAEDAKAAQDLEDSLAADVQATVADEGSTNRKFVQDKASEVISAVNGDIDAQHNATNTADRKAESDIRDYVRLAHSQIRTLENSNTNQIINLKASQEKQTRDNVDAQHTASIYEITTTDKSEESSNRATSFNEWNKTRALERAEQVKLRNHDSSEEATTVALDASEEAANRNNVVAEQAATRDYSANQHVNTNDVLASETAGEKTEVVNDEKASQKTIQTEAETTRAYASAQASQTRAMFSTLQVALQALYGAEGATLDSQWGTVIRLLIHYDLQGPRCDKFGETYTFSTLSSAGAGRLEQLRAETNSTMTINEAYYGANKVGSARGYWNTAEAYLAAGNYRVAADQYRLCYQEVIKTRSM